MSPIPPLLVVVPLLVAAGIAAVSSLIPRRVADAYCRLLQGRKLTTHTHSRRRLVELVRSAGLEPRLGVALPTYSEPQLCFDHEDFRRAWKFYLRHIYRYATPVRRLVGAVGRLLPARVFAPVVPTFWLTAKKGGAPAKLPTVVTGSGDCGADIKVVDYRMIGATGRVYITGEESDVRAASDAATGALEAVG